MSLPNLRGEGQQNQMEKCGGDRVELGYGVPASDCRGHAAGKCIEAHQQDCVDHWLSSKVQGTGGGGGRGEWVTFHSGKKKHSAGTYPCPRGGGCGLSPDEKKNAEKMRKNAV